MTQTTQALTVGVTGHRPNRLTIAPSHLSHLLKDWLAAISGATSTTRHIALSALAEGADRIFAEAALFCSYELHALLPFASDDYITTFGDPGTNGDYHHLLGRSASITALDGDLEQSTAAYAAVGEAIVDRSDILIAIWDGKPAAGKGGTPDVIDMSLTAGNQ